jgi:hypothetical protein
MYTIKYFCAHSGGVFTDTYDNLEQAQKEWDRLEFKRSIHMHTARPV